MTANKQQTPEKRYADGSLVTGQRDVPQAHGLAYWQAVEQERDALRADNARLREALQEVYDIAEGPGETDRPQWIKARAALKVSA